MSFAPQRRGESETAKNIMNAENLNRPRRMSTFDIFSNKVEETALEREDETVNIRWVMPGEKALDRFISKKKTKKGSDSYSLSVGGRILAEDCWREFWDKAGQKAESKEDLNEMVGQYFEDLKQSKENWGENETRFIGLMASQFRRNAKSEMRLREKERQEYLQAREMTMLAAGVGVRKPVELPQKMESGSELPVPIRPVEQVKPEAGANEHSVAEVAVESAQTTPTETAETGKTKPETKTVTRRQLFQGLGKPVRETAATVATMANEPIPAPPQKPVDRRWFSLAVGGLAVSGILTVVVNRFKGLYRFKGLFGRTVKAEAPATPTPELTKVVKETATVEDIKVATVVTSTGVAEETAVAATLEPTIGPAGVVQVDNQVNETAQVVEEVKKWTKEEALTVGGVAFNTGAQIREIIIGAGRDDVVSIKAVSKEDEEGGCLTVKAADDAKSTEELVNNFDPIEKPNTVYSWITGDGLDLNDNGRRSVGIEIHSGKHQPVSDKADYTGREGQIVRITMADGRTVEGIIHKIDKKSQEDFANTKRDFVEEEEKFNYIRRFMDDSQLCPRELRGQIVMISYCTNRDLLSGKFREVQTLVVQITKAAEELTA